MFTKRRDNTTGYHDVAVDSTRGTVDIGTY